MTSGTFYLKPLGPYDFDLTFDWYRKSRFEQIDGCQSESFIRIIEHDDVPVLIEIPYESNSGKYRIGINWYSPRPLGDTAGLRKRLIFMLRLDFDIDDFYARAGDRAMRRLFDNFRGFRPVMMPSVFETAAWAIIGQQVNSAFAFTIKSRLVELVGRWMKINGRSYLLFPRPSDIVKIEPAVLRSAQLSGRKIEYLQDFCAMITNNQFVIDDLITTPYDIARERLLAVRGIGEWTANYILMRGAGHQDAFPFGDAGIKAAIGNNYGFDPSREMDRMIELADTWRPYRSLAAFYLWKSLGG